MHYWLPSTHPGPLRGSTSTVPLLPFALCHSRLSEFKVPLRSRASMTSRSRNQGRHSAQCGHGRAKRFSPSRVDRVAACWAPKTDLDYRGMFGYFSSYACPRSLFSLGQLLSHFREASMRKREASSRQQRRMSASRWR